MVSLETLTELFLNARIQGDRPFVSQSAAVDPLSYNTRTEPFNQGDPV